MDDKYLKSLIREKNDWIRRQLPNLPEPHKLSLSHDVGELSDGEIMELLGLVRDFKSFAEENDPWSEHDFGKVELKGDAYYWKFDYYSRNLEGHEVNGTRLLTIYTPFEA